MRPRWHQPPSCLWVLLWGWLRRLGRGEVGHCTCRGGAFWWGSNHNLDQGDSSWCLLDSGCWTPRRICLQTVQGEHLVKYLKMLNCNFQSLTLLTSFRSPFYLALHAIFTMEAWRKNVSTRVIWTSMGNPLGSTRSRTTNLTPKNGLKGPQLGPGKARSQLGHNGPKLTCLKTRRVDPLGHSGTRWKYQLTLSQANTSCLSDGIARRALRFGLLVLTSTLYRSKSY